MSKKTTFLFWNLTGSLAYLTVPILLAPRPEGMALFSMPTLRDFLANCFTLLIFYLNYFWFIPSFYFKKKYVLYLSLIVLGFFTISLIPSLLTGFVPWDPPPPPPDRMNFPPSAPHHADQGFLDFFFHHISHNTFLYVMVILFSVLLRTRSRLLAVESLKHQAEINSLKSQINPHFLFNTLNNIYALSIREKADTTASLILKLSGMMRYVVTETAHELVDLEKEIHYTNDYIALQKMRITSSLDLSYEICGKIGKQKIAPLILMPFIENAFKYGLNPDEKSYIRIQIHILEDSLNLQVENQKVKLTQTMYAIQSGVGLGNTQARLQLLYPDKHALVIQEDSKHYKVQLTIDFT